MPRVTTFENTITGAANPLGQTIIENTESEYDLLITHFVVQGYDTAFGRDAMRAEIRVTLSESVVVIGAAVGNIIASGGVAYVCAELKTPWLMQPGERIAGYVSFSGGLATNTVDASGGGIYLPKMLI
ncbi:MAG: hypothetical protein ACC669_09360 [bacterium]